MLITAPQQKSAATVRPTTPAVRAMPPVTVDRGPITDRLPDVASLADLVERLGGVPLERIHLHPWPGTATEGDVVEWNERRVGVPRELVDGTAIDVPPRSLLESRLSTVISVAFANHCRPSASHTAFGYGVMHRMTGGNIRLPDCGVYRTSWLTRVYPTGRITAGPRVMQVAPDLFVEVLSESNTPDEIARKQAEFFEKGTRELWVVDPVARTVTVRRPGEDDRTMTEANTLTCEAVLPDFSIDIATWFAEAEDL